MGILSSLFGSGNDKLKEMLAQGALVIDVRSPGEFSSGHVKGSKNIPLQNIGGSINDIEKMGKPIVLCCASGMRSGQASRMLSSKGIECMNGGGWAQVDKAMKG